MVLMSLRCFTLVVVVGISSATIMLCSPVLILTNLKCMCYVVCNPLHSCSMNCSFEETNATSLCSTLYLRVHKLVPSFHKLLLHLRVGKQICVKVKFSWTSIRGTLLCVDYCGFHISMQITICYLTFLDRWSSSLCTTMQKMSSWKWSTNGTSGYFLFFPSLIFHDSISRDVMIGGQCHACCHWRLLNMSMTTLSFKPLVNSVLWSGFLVFVFADGCWFLGQIWNLHYLIL